MARSRGHLRRYDGDLHQRLGTIGVLATIQSDLGATPGEAIWITSVYALVVASLILAGGTLADLVGRRKMFLAGSAIVVVGSLLSWLSTSSGFLIAAQAVVGVGGALLLPSGLAVISGLFPSVKERTQAVSVWAGSSGIGLAVGPVLGGLVVSAGSWSALYLINVALGVLTLLGAARFIPESRNPGRRLDVVGALLGTVAVGALTFGIIEGRRLGYGSPLIIAAWVVFVVGVVTLLWYEARRADPMIDLRLFRSASFGAVMAVGASTMISFVGVGLLLVLYLQRVQGMSALGAGMQLLAALGPYVLTSQVAGAVVQRLGFRVVLTGGLLVMGGGVLLLLIAGVDSGPAAVWPGSVLLGVGAGLLVGPSTAAAVISVPVEQAGMASAVVNMFRQVGSVLGTSVLGTILASRFVSGLQTRLDALGIDAAMNEEIVSAAARLRPPPPLPPEIGTAVADATAVSFTSGYHLGVLVGGLILLATAIPTALFIRARPGG